MERTLLLDCYTDPVGCAHLFAPWIPGTHAVCRPALGEALPPVDEVGIVVITGSPSSIVAPLPWAEALLDWTRRVVAAGRPTLGVCFGHQVLGRALGGAAAVGLAERPEVGWLDVQVLRPDPLLPAGASVRAFLSHQDEVRPHPAFEVLASTPGCAVQALRHPSRPVWGVQFHPEVDRAEAERLVRWRAEVHPELELDPEALLEQRVDSAALADHLFGAFFERAGA